MHLVNLHFTSGFGIVGIGIASIVTNGILLITLEIYLRYIIYQLQEDKKSAAKIDDLNEAKKIP